MQPTLRLANAAVHRVHTPLIQFVGKRQWPSTPEPQHPHPAAPSEFQQAFSDFITKFRSSASTSQVTPQTTGGAKTSKGNVQVFDDFWQAPERLWKRSYSEQEIETISSGGVY